MMNSTRPTDGKQSDQLSSRSEAQLSRLLGVKSAPLAQMLLEQLYKAGIVFGKDDDPELLARGINALVGELAPVNALEATLVTQLCASHVLGMKELIAAANTNQEESKTLHYNLANKLQRTFLAQIEALTKLRGTRQLRMSVEQVSHDVNGNRTRTQLCQQQNEANR